MLQCGVIVCTVPTYFRFLSRRRGACILNPLLCTVFTQPNPRLHKRRIKTEEKAKVVAAVWGTECNQAVVAILHQVDLKKGMNSSYS